MGGACFQRGRVLVSGSILVSQVTQFTSNRARTKSVPGETAAHAAVLWNPSILFSRNSYKEAPAASGFAKETPGTVHCQSLALGVIRVFALGFPICEMGTQIYNFAFIISSIWELWLLFGSPT